MILDGGGESEDVRARQSTDQANDKHKQALFHLLLRSCTFDDKKVTHLYSEALRSLTKDQELTSQPYTQRSKTLMESMTDIDLRDYVPKNEPGCLSRPCFGHDKTNQANTQGREQTKQT